MTEQAIMKAEYSNYLRVKGRKVIQLVFELPLEQAPEVHSVLGEPGVGGDQVFCAIAKLDTDKIDKPVKVKKPLGISQKCALLCDNELFWRFLEYEFSKTSEMKTVYITSSLKCAEGVRQFLFIPSRSELDTNPEAAERWNKLLAEYERWKSE